MIKRDSSDFCPDCKRALAQQQPHTRLKVIGEEVILPGRSSTKYTFFQCSTCGHIWQHIEDRGFGGYGSVYSVLTREW